MVYGSLPGGGEVLSLVGSIPFTPQGTELWCPAVPGSQGYRGVDQVWGSEHVISFRPCQARC